jgi:hypothetical protein
VFKRTIRTSDTPQVTIEECLGNLTVRANTENEITLLVQDGEGDEAAWQPEGDALSIAIPANGTLVCPSGTALTVRRVLGNLRIERVKGSVVIGVVHGNTALREVDAVLLERALGNLSAREVAGRLESQDVRGNTRVRRVGELLTLGEVGGNLVAEGLTGGLMAERVRGNVRMGPPFSPEAAYRVEAHGNLTVHLPPDASLEMVLRAGGQVRSRVPGLALEPGEEETRGTLGSGESTLEADVKGNVTLRPSEGHEAMDMSTGWDELGAHVEWQMNDALARMATYLEESLGRVDGEQVRHRVDRATEQARRRAEQAAERARMRAEQAERRWRRASGQRSAPIEQGATDEERLRVLRMVEEGKITPEQASDLLGAIEGR